MKTKIEEGQRCKCGWIRPGNITFQPFDLKIESIGVQCPMCGEWSSQTMVEVSYIVAPGGKG